MSGRQYNKLRKLIRTVVLFPFTLMMGIPEGDPPAGDPPASDPPTDPGAGDPPAGDPPADPPADPAGDEPTYEQLSAQAKEISDKAEALRFSKLTDEEKAAEEAAKKANEIPEEYADFKMPEGMPADEQLLNDFKPVAKELGLPQDKAQKLIDLYAEKVAPLMVQRQTEAWGAQLETWVNECKADKEIGGDKFEVVVSDAQRVINSIGTPELKQVFDQYGLGNNPELVRVFSRMAKYLKEDGMETGGGTQQQTSIASRLYPNLPD